MRNKKIEKTHVKESNQMHNTIFMWFGNLPMSTELQEFRHYQGKIQYTVRLQFFSFIKTRQPTHNNNPNHQSRFHNGLNGQKKKKTLMPPDPQEACP